jgi:alkyl hydroperoxide reductase subunit AhpC
MSGWIDGLLVDVGVTTARDERQKPMTLHLGDEAPNFTAETTDGEIDFHEWKAGSWAVLFSHPADYTPVCTTELGRTAALKDGFASRDTKVLALSVDPIEDHKGWAPTSPTPREPS